MKKIICCIVLIILGFVSISSAIAQNDFQDKKIGVLLGSAHESYAEKTYPSAKVLKYITIADLIVAVKSKKVDVAIYDTEPLDHILSLDSTLQKLDQEMLSFDLGIGFNKKDTQLRNEFNQFLKQIKSDGVYQDMKKRWLDQHQVTMPEIANPGEKGYLTIGINDTGLPFVALENQQYIGFDMEMMQLFAATQHKKLKLLSMDFSSLVTALASGKVDMVAASLFITDERKKKIDFSDAYYAMTSSTFTAKNSSTSIDKKDNPSGLMSSLDDLKDKKIAVMLGSTHDTFAHKHYPEAEIMQYKSPSDVLLAVKTAKVDVGIYNSVSLKEILKTSPDIGTIGEPFEMMPVAFGFSKQNDKLLNEFNIFFKTIKENGVYQQMVDRWTKQENPVMPDIPTPNKNGLLVAGHVSDGGLPFVTIRDNQHIGMNIELAKRFAASQGKDIRFDDMEFGSLMPAVSTGKIDFIAVTLMITEERKQKINFAESYYEIGMSAFSLKKNILQNHKEKNAADEINFWQGVVNSFNSNIMQEKRYLLLWDGFKTTILISILSTIFGTLLGALVCFMRMSKHAMLNIPAKIYISILRGTPVLVILMLIFYVVFGSININPIFVATIAFGMNFGAYVAEIFRSGIQSIEKGQTEAGISLGFNKMKTFVYIILPQTIIRILPVYKGEFISLVKMTSIVGYIAVQDLTKASDIIRSRTFDAFFPLIMIAILYFLISWLLMQSLNYLEKVTDPKYKRKAGKSS